MRPAIFGMMVFVVACGSSSTTPPADDEEGGGGGTGGEGGTDPCPSPNRVVDGICLVPGQQDDGCAAGEYFAEGVCRKAGVAPSGCPDGFELTSDRCVPILVEDCSEGLMAPPGETTCRPPMACGDGPWGDIPVGSGTVYVDQAYGGGDSDGTATKPFTTIPQGIAAASAGAVVAVAEGTYSSMVVIQKPVALWGVCPAKVRLESSVNLAVLLDAAGAELRGFTITGGGVYVSNVEDIVIEGVHVVEAGDIGILAGADVGASVPASVTVKSSLVERAKRVGIIGFDSELVVEGSVIRDSVPNGVGFGTGIGAQQGLANLDASLTVRRTLVQGAHEAGIYTSRSTVSLESVAVLDVVANQVDDVGGYGLSLQSNGGPSVATVNGLYLRNTQSAGLFVIGSEAVLENVTIDQVALKPSDELYGNGLLAVAMNGGASNVVLTGCAIDDTHESGIAVLDSVLSMSGCIVQKTSPRPDGLFGHGVSVAGTTSELNVIGSVIDDNVAMGVLVDDAEATLIGNVIRNVSPSPDGLFGDGAVVVGRGGPASLSLAASVVSDNSRAGLTALGAALSVESTELSCNEIALVAETYDGTPSTLDDAGGNHCHCGDSSVVCKAASATVTPPSVLPDPPEPVSEE